jgi:hypothetical protein
VTIADEVKSRTNNPRLHALIDAQTARGIAKYGQTLDENDAPLANRLVHFIQECVDAAQYAHWIVRHDDVSDWDAPSLIFYADVMLCAAARAAKMLPAEVDLAAHVEEAS